MPKKEQITKTGSVPAVPAAKKHTPTFPLVFKFVSASSFVIEPEGRGNQV